MNVRKILIELNTELRQIQAAITALECLQSGVRRRGRPPAWLVALQRGSSPPAGIRRGRPRRSKAPAA